MGSATGGRLPSKYRLRPFEIDVLSLKGQTPSQGSFTANKGSSRKQQREQTYNASSQFKSSLPGRMMPLHPPFSLHRCPNHSASDVPSLNTEIYAFSDSSTIREKDSVKENKTVAKGAVSSNDQHPSLAQPSEPENGEEKKFDLPPGIAEAVQLLRTGGNTSRRAFKNIWEWFRSLTPAEMRKWKSEMDHWRREQQIHINR